MLGGKPNPNLNVNTKISIVEKIILTANQIKILTRFDLFEPHIYIIHIPKQNSLEVSIG